MTGSNAVSKSSPEGTFVNSQGRKPLVLSAKTASPEVGGSNPSPVSCLNRLQACIITSFFPLRTVCQPFGLNGWIVFTNI